MRLELLAAVATEPVSLAQAKIWLRVDHNAEDALIGALISSARDYVEAQTGRALAAQSWRFAVRPEALPVEIPRPPFGTLLAAEALLDDGTAEALDVEGFMAIGVDPCRVLLRPDVTLPYRTMELRFDYTCAVPVVPPQAIQAMRLLIAQWYEKREALQSASSYQDQEPPHSVTALLNMLKLVRL